MERQHDQVFQIRAPDNDAETIQMLQYLQQLCPRFNSDYDTQKNEGLSKRAWRLWVRTIAFAGFPEAAHIFSENSPKYDDKSYDLQEEIFAEVPSGGGPMPRCTTFGCSEDDIKKCHSEVRLNPEGAITNSPGAFLREKLQEEPIFRPPSQPIYKPYIEALQKINDYDLDQTGNLCANDRKGNPFPIANFVARPILEVIRDDGMSEDRAFRIEGILSEGKALKSIDVTAADFSSMNWILKNWGIEPSIRPGMNRKELVRDAIQNLGFDVQKHRIFTHLGWRQLEDGRWVYLHAGGCIGAEAIDVELDAMCRRYRLPEKIEDPLRAAKTSLALLEIAPHSITIPLLGLTFLAPLLEPFKQAGLEPNFVVWLYGITGSRKTSLSMLFLSHFGDFFGKNPPASFKDTANALERRSFATKDSLLLIDDYHPAASKSEAQNMAQTAQKVLRMFGDRIGRGRLKSTIDFQKEYPPRGMGLITGEDIISGQSSLARLLGIEILPQHVDLSKLSQSQSQAFFLAQSMAGYIKWLIPDMPTLPDLLSESFVELRHEFQNESPHGRLGESAAWLYIGFSMALGYFEEVGACDESTSKDLLSKAYEILMQIISHQGELIVEEQPTFIFQRTLKELLALGKVQLIPIQKAFHHNEMWTNGEIIGWFDDQYYYLLPEATLSAIIRFLNTRGERFPVNSRMLFKHLDEAGWIRTEVTADGHVQRCPKKKVPSQTRGGNPHRPRLLHLHRSVLDEEND